MTILPDDLLDKPLQYLLVRYVANKVIPSLLVDDTDMGTGLLKLIGNTTSDALSASRHDGYFILEFFHIYFSTAFTSVTIFLCCSSGLVSSDVRVMLPGLSLVENVPV